MPRGNGSQKKTAVARAAPPAIPTITRAEANKLLKQRAQELFHEARAQRDEHIRRFEEEFGRADRIDHTLLSAIQNIQVRFAAIAARQHTYSANNEPKVSKYAKQLGDIIGDLSAHLATQRALELFAPIEEREYVGVGGFIGRKGLDESILDGRNIVEDQGAAQVTPTPLDDGEVCLHEQMEPSEDDTKRAVCADCGEEFQLAEYREAVT